MAQWLFCTEKTTGVEVALGRATVTGERHHRRVTVRVTGPDRAVTLHRHRVTRRVQHLVADDDRVQVEVVRVGVPPTVVDPAEHPQQVDRVHPTAPGHPVLAVAGEGVVLRPLRGLLAQQRGPQAQLALALQGEALRIHPPHQDQVAVEALDRLVVDVVQV
jgi:hypothetical protein